jgi:hypothetical protein
MNRAALWILASLTCFAPGDQAVAEVGFSVEGFIGIRGGWVEGPPSWVEGGFGRLYAGADGPGDSDLWGRAEGQLALSFDDGASWQASLHALSRLEDSDAVGDAVGLTEAWLGYRRAIDNASELSLRAGLFFYPSSQENIDPLWGSPYTLSYSAINSWFGEEFRPLGLDLAWRRFLASGAELSLGGTIFGGNDTLGTLLAWRGWSMHDRLSVYGERLALPPVFSLEPDRYFGLSQRSFRTTAFGSDLDRRPGYAVRLRAEQPGRLNGQLAWVDNRGDRELHGKEYAWHTRFLIVGGHWQLAEALELMAEWTHGRTTMNFPGMPWVDADFRAAYLMGSWDSAMGRLSLRHDRFVVDDRIRNPMWGLFDDRGQAWTLAWIRSFSERSRLGLELLWLDSRRVVAEQSGQTSDSDGLQLSVEARWLF